MECAGATNFYPEVITPGGGETITYVHPLPNHFDISVAVNQNDYLENEEIVQKGGHGGAVIRYRDGDWSLHPEGSPFYFEVEEGERFSVTLRCIFIVPSDNS
ncbi:hypothetical protein H735_04465 [Vibrio owensii CAIM 1854 = LMG 25443]|uniref:Uncharacterized protein n=1 Tax=Vibrio owensii CAIM 1854 = LMG 25443 TaxID=1229493 RepID=A0A0C1ZAZ3_9VIBR|nr:hypothetical protein H735_04465 [Vibrio owensii CAIM 1854 = LMG 25443]